jgi:hypothetical protein
MSDNQKNNNLNENLKIKSILSGNNATKKLKLLSNMEITTDLIDLIIEDPSPHVVKYAAQSPHITKEQIEKILTSSHETIKEIILKNPNCPISILDHYLDNPTPGITYAVAQNPNLTENQIDTLIKNNYTVTPCTALHILSKNPKLSQKQISTLLKHTNYNIVKSTLLNPNITEENINSILSDLTLPIQIQILAAENPKISITKLNELLYKDPNGKKPYNSSLAIACLNNPKIESEHLTPLLTYDSPIPDKLAKHSKLTSEQIDLLIKNKTLIVQINLAGRQELTDHQFKTLLLNRSVFVEISLGKNNKITEEQLSILLKTCNSGAKIITLNHPKINQEHLKIALQDPDEEVKEVAIKKHYSFIENKVNCSNKTNKLKNKI